MAQSLESLLEEEEGSEYDISEELYKEIATSNIKHGPDARIAAAAHWVVLGSTRAVGTHLGIPDSSIRMWMRKPWWKELVKVVRRAKQEELDAKLTGIIMGGADQLIDRVHNGNWKEDKDGNLRRVPLTSGELAKDAIGIPYDKRQLIRINPEKQKKDKGIEETLTFLAEQFVKIARQDIRQINIVEGEFEEVTDGATN